MESYIRKLFTSAGLRAPTGNGRVSYGWCGFAPYAFGQSPIYQPLLNGEMTFSESADVTDYATTAFNGFRDGTIGTSIIKGSVTGFIQGVDATPAPLSVEQPPTTKLWWIKVLLGTVYLECTAAITNLSVAGTPDEVVKASFDYQFLGLPRVYQYSYIVGGSEPA